jgi:NhaP-type Na+/H+ or K+/H+ antiporter
MKVPPIIFEAALSIDKKSFNRHIVPILFYAVCGTLMATLLTALVVFYASHILSNWCTPIPFVEAMTFGALISSIDPIAVLSVLSNMGMTDKDTIYVVIFGESLLNDGIAIVLFETLVHFLDENLIIDSEAISLAAVHFSVVAIGSLLIGVASGMLSTVYFWMFHGCQTPMVEVLMFFCWALLPYYVCDGIGWSGIVAAVAVGFVMDVAIVGQKSDELLNDTSEGSDKSFSTPGKRTDVRERRRILDSPDGHLSAEARTHIHFVAEIVATVMETAIFAYLGLFLFSHRYHWNFWHTVVAILACCLSRAIMIPTLSCLANRVTRIQQRSRGICTTQHQHAQRKHTASMSGHSYPPAPPGVVIDRKMQIVLWFSGLRGAMSFALVEHIPLYDSVSGEGTPLKPELKAMTSATILFTVFVLGGYTYYIMDRLGLAPTKQSSTSETELVLLLSKSGSSSHQEESLDDEAAPHHIMKSSPAPAATSSIATSMTTTTISPTKRAGATALPGNRRRQRAIFTENGN